MELFLLATLAAGFTYAMHLGGKGPKNEPFPTIHSKWEIK